MPRTILQLFAVSLAFLSFCAIGTATAQPVKSHDALRQAIFNDPEAPVGGNPKGDVTIVAFEDYNCTNCKASEPALQKLVKDDGHIRVVYKDWPIFGKASVYGAEIALAAKYQGKYLVAHDVLMKIPGASVSKTRMTQALRDAGVDIDRLHKDLKIHDEEIRTLIHRNTKQAAGLGYEGTPIFLIGPYNVNAVLDYAGFKKFVAKARADEGK